MPQYHCPHCNEEIEHLNYYENATIYGSYDIETEDYEQEETEPAGGARFECPGCNEKINSIDDLIDTEEEERLRERQRERNRPALDFNINPERSRPIPTLDLSPLDTEEERELPVPPAIDQNWRGEYSGYHNSHDRQKQSAILTCPNCGSKNEAIENETIECYKCGKEVNLLNAKKTIPVEKPSNPNF